MPDYCSLCSYCVSILRPPVFELKPEIEALGIRHVRYGVKPMHYEAVVNALLWTLQTGLGAEWNEEVREAWETCYKEVASIMMKAMATAL